MSSAVEIERKYSVPEGTPLPALDAVAGVVSAEIRPVALLEAVYLDTSDRVLLTAGIVLRRRTGGHDAGWHIKLRRGPVGRTELHAPIDEQAPDRVPEVFEAALRTRLRGRGLTPIARIRTERTAVVVTDGAGGAVEVVDDVVMATDVAAGVLRAWREWEAEQADDTAACRALLERIDEVLVGAGASPSASPAKIAQALGLVGADRPSPAPSTAGVVVASRLREHTEALHGGIQSLVLDPDATGSVVHELRKTIRRARSLLALRAVAGPAGVAVRDGLGELGRLLGEARDPLVAAGVAAHLLEELPDGTPGVDAARALLVDDPVRTARSRTASFVERLEADDVLSAIADLESYVPDGDAADAPPKTLVALAEREVRRARRRGRRGLRGGLDALHDARKAAKRARFVVEELVAAGVLPRKSKLRRAARRAAQASDAFGDHRDLTLVLDALPAASERLTASGGNAFALGLAAERGRAHLAALRRAVERAAQRLD